MRCTILLTGARAADALLRTRESLAAQELPPVEVLDARGSPNDVAAILTRATGDFVAFVDAGDRLQPDALARVGAVAGDDVDVVYTDEECVAPSGGHLEPFYKPDWSPDRLRCQHYTGRLCALRRSLVEDVGGLCPDMAPCHEWDLVLRTTERARRVEHVAAPLYERSRPTPLYGDATAPAQASAVVGAHLDRAGVPATVEWDEKYGVPRLRPALDHHPLVSIVIPTAGTERVVRGRPLNLIENCVRSILASTTYPNYEVVCVYDEGATSLRVLDVLRDIGRDRLRLVPYARAFNFSEKVNRGAIAAAGEYLLLLNDDVEVITPTWIEELAVHAMQPEVGAAGPTLLLADTRIQHAGIGAVQGDPGHVFYKFPSDHRGYYDNLRVPADCLGVTAACLLTPRSAFHEVGGLSTAFPLNYNDVDFCLKLHQAGYRVVHTPAARLFHFESSSRVGGDVDDEELELLRSRWESMLWRDPYYNPNFFRGTVDFLARVLPCERELPVDPPELSAEHGPESSAGADGQRAPLTRA